MSCIYLGNTIEEIEYIYPITKTYFDSLGIHRNHQDICHTFGLKCLNYSNIFHIYCHMQHRLNLLDYNHSLKRLFFFDFLLKNEMIYCEIYWKIPTSTVWKSKKSHNTFLALVTKNVCWFAGALSIFFITFSTNRSIWITVASYELKLKDIFVHEYEFRKYWQLKPTSTVWKPIESINTLFTLLAKNV